MRMCVRGRVWVRVYACMHAHVCTCLVCGGGVCVRRQGLVSFLTYSACFLDFRTSRWNYSYVFMKGVYQCFTRRQRLEMQLQGHDGQIRHSLQTGEGWTPQQWLSASLSLQGHYLYMHAGILRISRRILRIAEHEAQRWCHLKRKSTPKLTFSQYSKPTKPSQRQSQCHANRSNVPTSLSSARFPFTLT